METLALRPRTATEIVDAAFRLCRAHYWALVTATAVIVAPALILKLIPSPFTTGLGEVLENLLLSVSDGAVIAIVSEAYLGRSADAGSGLRKAFDRMGALIGSSIARNLIIAIGLLALIVPGVLALAWTFAVPMVIVLEGESTGTAFSRARDLARGQVGHVLATLLLLLAIVFGLLMGIALTFGVAAELMGMGERVIDLTLEVALIAIYPMFSVGGTLLYYDLRIKKEGFDLEIMEQNLAGNRSMAVPSAAPTSRPGS